LTLDQQEIGSMRVIVCGMGQIGCLALQFVDRLTLLGVDSVTITSLRADYETPLQSGHER
jgi:D-arabinose 5-phosphate isomerase GutQ